MRLIFMGTPDFALPALGALAKSPHQVVAIYSQPPRPAGRGMAKKNSPVQLCGEQLGVPVFSPNNFKDPKEVETFQNFKADFAVVAAYGLLLPEIILNAPRYGCINIHASLLPRWRGASPIQAAILAGDAASGISIMQVEKGLDTGPVFTQKSLRLTSTETAGSLHDKLSTLAAEMIVPALEEITAGRLVATPQEDEKATYAPKISKQDGRVDWQRSAVEIERMVRAFMPFPGAWFLLNGKRIRILEGSVAEGQGVPGKVLDTSLTIACGTGAYRIERLQKEGKKPMGAEEFLRGQTVKPGEVLDQGQ